MEAAEGPVALAQQATLAAFRWVDGHADVAAVLRDAEALRRVGPGLAGLHAGEEVTVVAALEARGFVPGALVAAELGVGLVLVRKEGRHHPGQCVEAVSRPDWRGRALSLRLHPGEIRPGDRVLLVDDWVETGAQAEAVLQLVERCGGVFVGVAALVDDTTDEQVRERLRLRALLRSGQLGRFPYRPPSS